MNLVNKDYEKAILSLFVSGYGWTPQIIEEVNPDVFTGVERTCFSLIKDMTRDGAVVNFRTLNSYALKIDPNTPITMVYVVCLDEAYVPVGGYREYLAELEDLRIERAKIAIRDLFLTESENMGIDTAVSNAIDRIEKINDGTAKDAVPIGSLLDSYRVRLVDYYNGTIPPPVVSKSGIWHLDKMLGGFKPTEFILIGGRPAMGKTTLALQLALNQATSGTPVAFVSLEMSEEQLCGRVLSNLYDFDGSLLNDPSNVDRHVVERVSGATESFAMSDIPLFIFDIESADLLTIEATARRLIRKHKIAGIYIDYLQLIRPFSADRTKSKYEQITAISIALKNLAKRLKIWVCVVSSLSRGVDSRNDHRPIMADLRESGQLEYDADKIMFVYRPAEYMNMPEKEQYEHYLEVIIRKHRSGGIGTILSRIDLKHTRVSTWDEMRDDVKFRRTPPANWYGDK
jgi:replicative DNA helicase